MTIDLTGHPPRQATLQAKGQMAEGLAKMAEVAAKGQDVQLAAKLYGRAADYYEARYGRGEPMCVWCRDQQEELVPTDHGEEE